MPIEPKEKRVVAFIDGQNLFHSVKDAFGYSYPNYDVQKLSHAICLRQNNWILKQTRFYSGIPTPTDNHKWHNFWKKKLAAMGRNTYICTRNLKYRIIKFKDINGIQHNIFGGIEKGIDVRIALDIIRGAHELQYDVALVFSQDQDLSEVIKDIISIAHDQHRWIKIASAFPKSPIYDNRRGINGTTWCAFDKGLYDTCLDLKVYNN